MRTSLPRLLKLEAVPLDCCPATSERFFLGLTPGCCENIRYFPEAARMVQPEFAYVHYVHLHSLMLGSEIGKFRAVNSSLSAGIPVLVKLLCLMESCNVYNHSHHFPPEVVLCFHMSQTFHLFAFSVLLLCFPSEISTEKSSAAHRRTVSNVPNVLPAILSQNSGILQAAGHDWSLGHATLH